MCVVYRLRCKGIEDRRKYIRMDSTNLFEGILPFCHPECPPFLARTKTDISHRTVSSAVEPNLPTSGSAKRHCYAAIEKRLSAIEANMSTTQAGPVFQPPFRIDVSCAFGREIYPFLQKHIQSSPFIVGCMYHITNRLLINDLSTRDGVCLLTMHPSSAPHGHFSPANIQTQPQGNSTPTPSSVHSIPEWLRVKGVHNKTPLRYVYYRDRSLAGQCPLMHHKFVIGLSVMMTPEWVISGSFNFTRLAAEIHDENVLYTNAPDVVHRFFVEFNRLYDISRPSEEPSLS